MRKAAAKLDLFLDNNVPDSIGDYLQSRGHSVFWQRAHIPADSPDPIVATTAMEAGRILVTQDKDFNNQRFMKERYAHLSRISLVGPAHTLLAAVKEHIDLIEYQWARGISQGATRMIAFVKAGDIRFKS